MNIKKLVEIANKGESSAIQKAAKSAANLGISEIAIRAKKMESDAKERDTLIREVLNKVQGTPLIKSIELNDQEDFEHRTGTNLQDMGIVIVETDDLEPSLCRGDQLLINTSINIYNGDGIYAFKVGGNTVVRGVKYVGNGNFEVFTQRDINEGGCEIYDQETFYSFAMIGKSVGLKFGYVPDVLPQKTQH